MAWDGWQEAVHGLGRTGGDLVQEREKVRVTYLSNLSLSLLAFPLTL